jgi:hypothetical protein
MCSLSKAIDPRHAWNNPVKKCEKESAKAFLKIPPSGYSGSCSGLKAERFTGSLSTATRCAELLCAARTVDCMGRTGSKSLRGQRDYGKSNK